MRGRQFGEDTCEFYVVESATASLAARAAATLRREHQLARQATVTLRTNRHKPGYQQLSQTVRFRTPTADTFNPRLEYHKADILLTELISEEGLQTDLLGTIDLAVNRESRQRMLVLDTINRQHGNGTIKFAAETLSQAWQPRKRLVSPRYTSAWDELPDVHPR